MADLPADTTTPAGAEAATTGPSADLAQLKRYFNEFVSLTVIPRQESLTDLDYYDGKQWTAEELATLRARKQPEIVINRIKPAINGVLGVTERSRSDPRAYPRTPQDEDSADVATDTLRYIAEFNRFHQLRLSVFRDILVPGSGAAIVEVDEDRNVTIEQIRWEEFFYDPRSRKVDFSDARYMGIAKWRYADEVKAEYADKGQEIENTLAAGPVSAVDESFQDRPQIGINSWVDFQHRRLMVVEMYYREGLRWKYACFHAGGILQAGESPYLDHKGKPSCPIEAGSAFVDRENKRYGAVRDMRGPQDEINMRRSKLLHLVNTRQIQETGPGQGMGSIDEARREAARPDGALPSGWQVVPTNDMTTGQLELLQEAKAEMERMGPNPAILGRQGADASGRAVLARQQAGLVELAILFGALDDWELRIYRQCWARAKQFWKAPMWIRVTDDENTPQFVGINQPPTQQIPQMGPNGQPQVGPDGQPIVRDVPGRLIGTVNPQTGQPAQSGEPAQPVFHMPDGRMQLGYKNAVAEMDVDIILDQTPDTANLQQEQFQDLIQLVGSNPNYAQAVPFEVLLKLSAIPHKREILDQLHEISQANAPMQQRQQMLAQQKVVADIRKTDAQAEEAHASAQQKYLSGLTEAHEAGFRVGQSSVPQPPEQPDTASGQ